MRAPHRQLSDTPSLFTQGFRPFFLAGSLWAVVAIAVWIWMLLTGASFPSRFDPLSWHIHEMLFGFVMAVVAGFLLTAIPNWTGRLPISGPRLMGLAGLWLLGRVVVMMSLLMPEWLATLADLAFPAALVAAAAREIIAGRNWRNLIVLAPVTVLGAGNLLMHLQVMGAGVPDGLSWRVALAALGVLLSVIGGRIVPSFTRNWLVKKGATRLPAPMGWPDRVALAFLHTALFGWAIFPASPFIGWLAIVAAATNLWRVARWRGAFTREEPLLLILHVGYVWLAVSSGLLGLAALTAFVPETAAVHALTVGAIGTMTLAVMTRATRGHTGRPLSADLPTTLIFVLVTAAALFRVGAEFQSHGALTLIVVAAALWAAAFLLFVVAYARMLLLKPTRGA